MAIWMSVSLVWTDAARNLYSSVYCEKAEQTAGPSGIVEIGRSHVDCQQQTQGVYQDVSLAPLDVLVCVKATDPRRLLDRFHADAASRMAALGCSFLPTRVRSAPRRAVSKRNHVPVRRKRRK